MIDTIGSVIAGLFAAIAGLFAAILGLGIGLAAMMAMLAPVVLMLLIPLLPILLLIWLLRRMGIIRGRLGTVAVLLIGILLLVVGANYGWRQGVTSVQDWFEDNREVLEACSAADGATITLEFDDGSPHFTCHPHKKRDTGDDAHI